ncbi:MAG: NAD-dependent DNA ligase LigA, partial [Bacteroidia bacterium]|nr:NAD-dependent DNA ligase LigA [Bacteroidia bacterium]
MAAETAQKRILELTEEIEKHNYLYYVEAKPIISDYHFDQLLAELIRLEKEFPQFKQPNSPTERVGGSITKEFPVFVHKKPLLSLANSYSIADLQEFDSRIEKNLGRKDYSYLAQIKIDGVAISLHYDLGLLQFAVTRGDGTQGDIITDNIKTI